MDGGLVGAVGVLKGGLEGVWMALFFVLCSLSVFFPWYSSAFGIFSFF